MDERLKQRLVGGAVLVTVAVIFLPMVLDDSTGSRQDIVSGNIPPWPEQAFRSRIVPLDEPPPGRARAPAAAQAVPQPAVGTVASEPPAVSAPPAKASAALPAESGADVRVGLTAWAVQLGSFSQPGNAIGLRDRLRAKGFAAFVETVYVDKKRITRVYVGPELLRAKASASQKRLAKEFKTEGLVVRYPGG